MFDREAIAKLSSKNIITHMFAACKCCSRYSRAKNYINKWMNKVTRMSRVTRVQWISTISAREVYTSVHTSLNVSSARFHFHMVACRGRHVARLLVNEIDSCGYLYVCRLKKCGYEQNEKKKWNRNQHTHSHQHTDTAEISRAKQNQSCCFILLFSIRLMHTRDMYKNGKAFALHGHSSALKKD